MNNIWLLNIFFASIWWNNWNAFYDKIDILNSTNKTTNNLESIFIYFLKRTLTLLIKLHQLLLNLNSQPLRIQYFLNLSNQFLRLPIQLLQLLILPRHFQHPILNLQLLLTHNLKLLSSQILPIHPGLQSLDFHSFLIINYLGLVIHFVVLENANWDVNSF